MPCAEAATPSLAAIVGDEDESEDAMSRLRRASKGNMTAQLTVPAAPALIIRWGIVKLTWP